jgi:hypothetical protein
MQKGEKMTNVLLAVLVVVLLALCAASIRQQASPGNNTQKTEYAGQ